MEFKIHRGMLEAARLTREGRLTEATSLIQRLLTGEAASNTDASAKPSALPPVIIDHVPHDAGEASPHSDLEAVRKSDSEASAKAGLLSKLLRWTTLDQKRPAVTPGARFLALSHTGAVGTRDYKLYIPSSYNGRPMPLMVMLHGCTQSAADFADGTGMNALSETRGFLVAYPEQPASANANKCWNWFNVRDQKRDGGEPAIIAGIARDVIANYAIDTKRVYVAGLSAGGAAAAIMGTAYPDLFAAIGVHSGLPVGSANDVASALAAMQSPKEPSSLPHAAVLHGRGRLVPTIVFHGDRDKTVHLRNGHHVIEQSRRRDLGELRADSQHGHVPDGHTYTRTLYRDAAGRVVLELWVVHGAGHAWSGGRPEGSFTDPRGPDASREMARFFLEHPLPRS